MKVYQLVVNFVEYTKPHGYKWALATYTDKAAAEAALIEAQEEEVGPNIESVELETVEVK